jgi:hypothetical protein
LILRFATTNTKAVNGRGLGDFEKKVLQKIRLCGFIQFEKFTVKS